MVETTSTGWIALLIIAIVLMIIAVVGYVESSTAGVSTWVWVVLLLSVFVAILALVVYFRSRKPAIHIEHHEMHKTENGNYVEKHTVHTHGDTTGMQNHNQDTRYRMSHMV